MGKLISIIPGKKNEVGASLCQGTKVLNGDGTPIEGVTRIELIAEAGKIWRAVIHANVQPSGIDGVEDVTDHLMSHSRSFVDGGYTGHSPLAKGEVGAGLSSLQSRTHLDRIEAKLDALLDALADEVEPDELEQRFTLDGEVLPNDRPEGEPL